MININEFLVDKSDAERTRILAYYLKALAALHASKQFGSIKLSEDSNTDKISVIPTSTELLVNQDDYTGNLVNCLSQLYPRYDRYLSFIWDSYQFNDRAPVRPGIIEKSIYKQRKKQEKALNVCFKNSKHYKVEKDWHHFQVIQKKHDSKDLRELLANPDKAIAQGFIFKDCPATTVSLFTMANGKKIIIKRYNSKGTFYSLTRSLISSRARVCWKGALLLKQLGIQTPDNLAILEHRTGPWIKTSYLITEFKEGELFVDYFNKSEDQSQWKLIARQVEDILFTFPTVRVAHGDFKSTNFILSNNKVLLIDLDSMKSHLSKSIFEGTYQRDIDRFERNWQEAPNAQKLFASIIKHIRSLDS